MKRVALILVAVVMLVSMVSFANAASFDKPEKFVVNVQTRLNVRSGPGMKYNVFAQLRNGTVIDVAGYENGWAIVLHDFGHGYAESIGYVDPAYLTRYKGSSSNSGSSNITTAGTTKYRVNADMSGWLNVRKAKSTSSARLGRLYPGDTVYVVSQSGNWSKIVYNGRYAYVMSKYISKGVSQYELPAEGELFVVNVASGTTLNVRTGMSKKNPLITRIPDGAYIKVLEIYDEWSKICYKTGKTGYVMNQFITPVK